MGSKKAQKQLGELMDEMALLAHAVGALRSCKDRLEAESGKLAGQSPTPEQLEKKMKTLKLIFGEMDKKWKEWPGYEKSCRTKAASVKKYCADNKKKHSLRPDLGKELDKISGKVDGAVTSIDQAVKTLKTFTKPHSDWKAMLA